MFKALFYKPKEFRKVLLPERGFVAFPNEKEAIIFNEEYHLENMHTICNNFAENSNDMVNYFHNDYYYYIKKLLDKNAVVFINRTIIHFGEYEQMPELLFASIGELYLPKVISENQKELLFHYLQDFKDMRSLDVYINLTNNISLNFLETLLNDDNEVKKLKK